jgi:hypothetical protein
MRSGLQCVRAACSKTSTPGVERPDNDDEVAATIGTGGAVYGVHRGTRIAGINAHERVEVILLTE